MMETGRGKEKKYLTKTSFDIKVKKKSLKKFYPVVPVPCGRLALTLKENDKNRPIGYFKH